MGLQDQLVGALCQWCPSRPQPAQAGREVRPHKRKPARLSRKPGRQCAYRLGWPLSILGAASPSTQGRPFGSGGWRACARTIAATSSTSSPSTRSASELQPTHRKSGAGSPTNAPSETGLDSDRRCDYPVAAMFNVRPRKSAQPLRHATAQPLRLGAAVRLRGRGVTGVVIGNSPDIDRVRVRWDDTDEVAHCLRASLEQAR
jgi:hypothetical protein